MTNVSHELGSLRYVVDSPLSSKVAMFNSHAEQHQQSQLRNPFSGSNGRSSPKPSFSRDEYGKPIAGSLTEMRGQKANMHILKEMVELCQIINSEGYKVTDEPGMRVIPFGELFNIYNSISDKVVGILLRARKHKLVSFEGEMLFQRRDDDVPIFLLKPFNEIRHELEVKIEDIKRASSPVPQATSVLMDRSGIKISCSPRSSLSPSASPSVSKAASPIRDLSITTIGRELDNKTIQPSSSIQILAPEIIILNENAEKVTSEVNNQCNVEEIINETLKIRTEEIAKDETEIIESLTEIGKENSLLEEQETTLNEKSLTEVPTATEMPIVLMEATAVYVRNLETLAKLKDSSNTTNNYLL